MQGAAGSGTYRMVVFVGTGGILLRPRNMQRTVVRKQRHLEGHLIVVASAPPAAAAATTTSARATRRTPTPRRALRSLPRPHIVFEYQIQARQLPLISSVSLRYTHKYTGIMPLHATSLFSLFSFKGTKATLPSRLAADQLE